MLEVVSWNGVQAVPYKANISTPAQHSSSRARSSQDLYSCKRIMNTSSIPDWARGLPSSSSALASADPVAAEQVEVTTEHLAMGDGLIEEHNARDDPSAPCSAPELVLQEARTLRETVFSGANGGINAHRFHIRLHYAVQL